MAYNKESVNLSFGDISYIIIKMTILIKASKKQTNRRKEMQDEL